MIELSDPDSKEVVADWIEFSLATTEDSISKTFVARIIERGLGQEPSDAYLSDVWRVLEYRENLYKLPFYRVQDRSVEASLKTPYPPEYLTCLLLSMHGIHGATQLPGKLFERITREAVERYLSGQAIVFGWPFDDPKKSDETILGQNIKKLAANLSERFIESPASRFKDRGVDVIGWITFGDGRSGQQVLLLQCGAGRHWANKKPVPMSSWQEFVHWAQSPTPGFAVPCVIDEAVWHDTSKEKGLLFDRIRIMNLLTEGLSDEILKQELIDWVNGQIKIFDQEVNK